MFSHYLSFVNVFEETRYIINLPEQKPPNYSYHSLTHAVEIRNQRNSFPQDEQSVDHIHNNTLRKAISVEKELK